VIFHGKMPVRCAAVWRVCNKEGMEEVQKLVKW